MSDWLTGLVDLTGRGEPVVLVTVVEARGSTPREPGARMTVGASTVHDTIGGGQLEHAAIESARLLLEQGDGGYINSVERHALSPRMGQCCGGVTRLLLERFPGERQPWADTLMEARRRREISFTATPLGGSGKQVIAGPDGIRSGAVDGAAREPATRCMATGRPVYDARAGWYVEPVLPPDFDVVLFGAGHVGRAVAGILATLPCTLTWVDSRADQFPAAAGANVRMQNPRRPESIVADCPPGAFYLLMTHSHQLDFDICERIMRRGDFAYCGMIGSQSKRRSCEKRLKLKGITESMLDRLTCPIGVPGISGKRPAEIAVAAVAEILQIREKVGTKREADASTAG